MNAYIYETIATYRLDSYRQRAAVERYLKACHKQRSVVVGRSVTDLLWRLRPQFK